MVLVTEASVNRFLALTPTPLLDEVPVRAKSTSPILAFAELSDAVARVVALAPPLSAEQREHLAVILGGSNR
jgi:hypothetical protein